MPRRRSGKARRPQGRGGDRLLRHGADYALHAAYAIWHLAAIAIGIPFLIGDEIRERRYRSERGDDA